MKPDWSNLNLSPGVLREPTPDDGQLVLWLPGETVDGYRHWERIASVQGAPTRVNQGLRQVQASVIRARQKACSFVGALLRSIWRTETESKWILPNGGRAEQVGEREDGRVIVWTESQDDSIAEKLIRERFGSDSHVREIGANLFVVSAASSTEENAANLEWSRKPLEIAKDLFAAAKKAKDCPKQASALVDLGVIHLRSGDAHLAAKLLNQALEIARKFGDKVVESDARTNLAVALRSAGKPEVAVQLLHAELVHARKAGDRFHEKLVLGHLGTVHAAMRELDNAITAYQNALTLARELNDRQHQADLFWRLAIQLADQGLRQRGIDAAESAIYIMAQLADPKVDQYVAWLDKYRTDFRDAPDVKAIPDPVEATEGRSAAAASSLLTSAAPAQVTGPGLLRMALSTAKSVAKFVRSGMVVTSNQTYQARLLACSDCPHHTGVRCKLCGCFTSIKARLPHEQCPEDRWVT